MTKGLSLLHTYQVLAWGLTITRVEQQKGFIKGGCSIDQTWYSWWESTKLCVYNYRIAGSCRGESSCFPRRQTISTQTLANIHIFWGVDKCLYRDLQVVEEVVQPFQWLTTQRTVLLNYCSALYITCMYISANLSGCYGKSSAGFTVTTWCSTDSYAAIIIS